MSLPTKPAMSTAVLHCCLPELLCDDDAQKTCLNQTSEDDVCFIIGSGSFYNC